MLDGQPRMLNHASRVLVTDWVEVEFNILYRWNPDRLSTKNQILFAGKVEEIEADMGHWCTECSRRGPWSVGCVVGWGVKVFFN